MITEIGKFTCTLFILYLLPACNNHNDNKLQENTIPVILDTDMESGVDDVGALAMMHAYADFSETELLGVMVCAVNPWSTLCADRINTYFNREDLPLGKLKGQGVDRESRYARQVAEIFPGTLQSADDAPDAVDQYREILSTQPDNSVVILSIGYQSRIKKCGNEFLILPGIWE